MHSFWTKHWALFGALSWVVAMALFVALMEHFNAEADAARSTSLRSTATLVGYTQSNDRDHMNRQTVRRFEVYEFESSAGERVRFSSPILGADAPRKLGEVVDILYPAVAPQAARLVDDGLQRANHIAFWVAPIGLIFAVPFLMVWLKERRRSTTPGPA